MGTRRMWLFLLLAAIQYAGVRASATPCAASPVATSECASYPSVPDCDPHTNLGSTTACSKAGYTLFLKKRNTPPWKELASVTCDAARNVWKATLITPSGETHDLAVADNLVCAMPAIPPPARPCAQCTTPPAIDCKEEEGCLKGGDVVKSIDPTTQCKLFTCPPSQFFRTDQPIVDVFKINCVSYGKWMTVGLTTDVEVTKAVCIEGYKCHLKTKLTSECTGLEASGCEKVDLTAFTDRSCSGKKMFYKKTGATAWVEATDNKLACNAKTTGLWTAAGTTPADLEAGEQVICADRNPDTPPTVPDGPLPTAPIDNVTSTTSIDGEPSASPSIVAVASSLCIVLRLYI